jgi:hypothetical protein
LDAKGARTALAQAGHAVGIVVVMVVAWYLQAVWIRAFGLDGRAYFRDGDFLVGWLVTAAAIYFPALALVAAIRRRGDGGERR